MPDILDELHQLIRLRGDTYSSYEVMGMVNRAADEIARLKIENWQLKGALGYPVPSHIPEGMAADGSVQDRARRCGA